MSEAVIIAVDGTAASGKGTLAKRLAQHFGFAHLDSGSLYRLTALGVLRRGGSPAHEADAVSAARTIDPDDKDNPELRRADIARIASLVAAIPAVRAALMDFQRRFACRPPGGAIGSVIDGRDIGTVICPGAAAKLFVDAAPQTRAHRRWLELSALGLAPKEPAILEEIMERDQRDRLRPVAPLVPAPDAALLDTSNLDIEAAFAAALDLVELKVGEALKACHRG